MAKRPPSNELIINRIYDAPVAAVWEAWTDPAQVAQWWGPRGFSITTHSKSLTVGGTWVYTMHGPDGRDWANITTYHEIEPLRRLVYDHGATATTPPLFRVTVTFAERGGKTHMRMAMRLPTAEEAAQTAKFVKAAGGNGTWDRLGEYLARTQRSEERFIINRSFEATPAQLFAAWTQPERLRQWLPPQGFAMDVLGGQIAEGQALFFGMQQGEVRFWGELRYATLRPHSQLVYMQEFCDAERRPAKHPGAPLWPQTLRIAVDFTEEEEGLTRVTLTATAHGQCSADELAAFLAERGGMSQGWTGSFDALDALLLA